MFEFMTTNSGRVINLFDLKVEDINLDEFTYALFNLSRFSGHCNTITGEDGHEHIYTVGMHSLLVYDLMVSKGITDKKLLLAGLCHDVPEVYTGFGDVNGNIKKHVPMCLELEDLAENKLAEYLYISSGLFCDECLKSADKEALLMEAKSLFDDLPDFFGDLSGVKTFSYSYILGNTPARFKEVYNFLSDK